MTATALPTVSGAAARIVGLDLARFVAIVGMMGGHLQLGAGPAWTDVPFSGFPSTLFAVLGGISAVLATRAYTERGEHLAAAVSLAARGLVVAAIGALLSLTPTFVIVVLVYFGVGLILLAPLLRLPIPAQAAMAAVLAGGGPVLNVTVRDALGNPDPEHIDLRSPLHAAASVLFTGTYPVVTWLVYLLVGVILGRLVVGAVADGRTRIVALRIAIVGAVVAAAAGIADAVAGRTEPVTQGDGAPLGTGWRFFADASTHTGSLGDLARTGGVACLVVGLLILATARLDRRHTLPEILRPLAAAGAAPLTLYSAHVLVTAVAPVGGTLVYLLTVLGAVGVGAVLLATRRRGPLERLVSAAARTAGNGVRRIA
ncbi:MAG: DUF1624 domain-containing protein [Micrococcales bacterium]|nr:DUF1624 domain-containing protein [Micrococcales bacterium]